MIEINGKMQQLSYFKFNKVALGIDIDNPLIEYPFIKFRDLEYSTYFQFLNYCMFIYSNTRFNRVPI